MTEDRCTECQLVDDHSPTCRLRHQKMPKPTCAQCGKPSWHVTRIDDRDFCSGCIEGMGEHARAIIEGREELPSVPPVKTEPPPPPSPK